MLVFADMAYYQFHGLYTLFGVVVIFSVSLKRQKHTFKFTLPLLPQYCYRGFYHAFMFISSMAFYVMEEERVS